MKKNRKPWLLFLLVLITHGAIAQEEKTSSKKHTPKWVSENGFWVVESNINIPKKSIIRFYTNEKKLIYIEQVEGVALNVKKRKTRINLKKVLDKVIFDWETNGQVKQHDQLVARLIK